MIVSINVSAGSEPSTHPPRKSTPGRKHAGIAQPPGRQFVGQVPARCRSDRRNKFKDTGPVTGPQLSDPESLLFWIMKKFGNGQETQAGKSLRHVTRGV